MSSTFPAFLSLLLAGVFPVSGVAQAPGPLFYRLATGSDYVQGCFPPCLCPVMDGAPVEGTFWLTPTETGGTFDTYAVSKVNWFFSANGIVRPVTGSGTYKVGGGTARHQQLSLDLQIADGSLQHFDSGLVSDALSFPKIAATISIHGQVCFDTVFNLVASPVSVPQLRAAIGNGETVLLAWPTASGDFILQRCSDLALADWMAVTTVPTITGDQSQVVLGRSSGREFYRLVPSE